MTYQIRRPYQAKWENVDEGAVKALLSGTFWKPEDALEALSLGIHVQLFTGEMVRSEGHQRVLEANHDGARMDENGILWT